MDMRLLGDPSFEKIRTVYFSIDDSDRASLEAMAALDRPCAIGRADRQPRDGLLALPIFFAVMFVGGVYLLRWLLPERASSTSARTRRPVSRASTTAGPDPVPLGVSGSRALPRLDRRPLRLRRIFPEAGAPL